jgi:hypothetical protein
MIDSENAPPAVTNSSQTGPRRPVGGRYLVARSASNSLQLEFDLGHRDLKEHMPTEAGGGRKLGVHTEGDGL